MIPYYADDWLTVYHGDARAVMAEMEPESVHCVVTSPPYWGLRDYGTATWLGGDDTHAHVGSVQRTMPPGSAKQASSPGSLDVRSGDCVCGAVRQDSQLGLEPTPEEYVANMVAVFREVRRVLRSDGTVWLNLGDSYVGPPVGAFNGGKGQHEGAGFDKSRTLKPKDLVGIPWRVAFALQADGWYLRSDIIWSKPNPMPESVTDRPTKSHEYLFLLSKSPRYYFDADAVREDVSQTPGAQAWRRIFDPTKQTKEAALKEAGTKGGNDGWRDANAVGRNIRSVWMVATRPYPGAHFATFPPKLVEPCIKAGTSERGVCPECGAPWVREIDRADAPAVEASSLDRYGTGQAGVHRKVGGRYQRWLDANPKETTGWRPSCSATCDYAEVDHQAPVPATVLDPFAGSGTTGMVAQSLSRRAVLIDLSVDYLGQLMDRNRDIPLGLGA